MHPKWRYEIFTCSVILGELESFRNYKVKGFSISFFPPKMKTKIKGVGNSSKILNIELLNVPDKIKYDWIIQNIITEKRGQKTLYKSKLITLQENRNS